ncbi:hypothetical protein [Rhodopseudomonas sp. B29]|uniref:hypothetical protein n=1 Tax=Rhodopseudomonas sp. B29 TaxID=95607 RepID=UPI00034C8E7C|nr:hypothetical protein [Rhodopseudomonas sp. B29]
MNIKASGRSALILATGLAILACAPLRAQPARADGAKVVKTTRVMAAEYANPETAPPTEPKRLADGGLKALPPEIANAHAEMPAPAGGKTETPAAAATTQPAPSPFDAPQVAQQAAPASDPGVVASDQLNDMDRAATETPAASTTTPAAQNTVAQVKSASADDGAWDKASLIGKIFIAVGGLLTLASAARMFMA